MTPSCAPSSSMTRTSRARIRSFTRMRSLCRKLRSAINPPQTDKAQFPDAGTAPIPSPLRKNAQGRVSKYSMRVARLRKARTSPARRPSLELLNDRTVDRTRALTRNDLRRQERGLPAARSCRIVARHPRMGAARTLTGVICADIFTSPVTSVVRGYLNCFESAEWIWFRACSCLCEAVCCLIGSSRPGEENPGGARC